MSMRGQYELPEREEDERSGEGAWMTRAAEGQRSGRSCEDDECDSRAGKRMLSR